MKTKVAQYVADFLVDHQVEDVFMVTGGGAMHLDDALGHKRELHCTFNHHEQACAIAAEGYARLTGKIAAVCVTSGPGGTNAITGVVGGWQDSIPMFIISGQVKRETTTWSTKEPLRQLGDQEFQIVDCVKGMTKYAVMITEPAEIRYQLEKAWYLCMNGRKGPVWIDIPLDIQAAWIDTETLEPFCLSEQDINENPIYDTTQSQDILNRILQAECPVVLAGTGIRLADAHKEFIEMIEHLQIPVVTAWNAHDVLWDNHPLYCGRPGTVGTRGGNFVVQNADLLLVLGCRLNIRQISYNYKQFAPNAYKIIIDIDAAELKKPTIHADLPIHANVKDVLKSINEVLNKHEFKGKYGEWLAWCRNINLKYPAVLPTYFESEKLNPYVFLDKLFEHLVSGDVTVTGNGGACVIGFQTARIKTEQRLFTNSGCAAMGYGFPAALGACVARKGKRVICIDGDGSFQMNIQELQTVVYNKLNMKIVILNNNGYHSIRQTQENLFEQPLIGVCDGNGISFPNMEKIAYAYGIPYTKIDSLKNIDKKLNEALESDGPIIIEAVVDEKQNFEPKLSSRVQPDGTIVSPPIDDMFPFLPREEYETVKAYRRK